MAALYRQHDAALEKERSIRNVVEKNHVVGAATEQRPLEVRAAARHRDCGNEAKPLLETSDARQHACKISEIVAERCGNNSFTCAGEN
jgi:hypothetical protein